MWTVASFFGFLNSWGVPSCKSLITPALNDTWQGKWPWNRTYFSFANFFSSLKLYLQMRLVIFRMKSLKWLRLGRRASFHVVVFLSMTIPKNAQHWNDKLKFKQSLEWFEMCQNDKAAKDALGRVSAMCCVYVMLVLPFIDYVCATIHSRNSS